MSNFRKKTIILFKHYINPNIKNLMLQPTKINISLKKGIIYFHFI